MFSCKRCRLKLKMCTIGILNWELNFMVYKRTIKSMHYPGHDCGRCRFGASPGNSCWPVTGHYSPKLIPQSIHILICFGQWKDT